MFRIVIPGRLASQRFPGKLSKELNGKSLIENVFNRCQLTKAESIHLAICPSLASICSGFTKDFWITPAALRSGTERIVYALSFQQWDDSEIIVNVQADEPLIDPRNISQVANLLLDSSDIDVATLWHYADYNEDKNYVKCVTDAQGRVLYFSRASIPLGRDENPTKLKHHLGIYAYRVGFLRKYAQLAVSEIERVENLEQLRILYSGNPIIAAEAMAPHVVGIDVPSQYEYIKKHWAQLSLMGEV